MWLCRHRGRLRCRGRLRRTLLGEAPWGEQLALFLRHPQRLVSSETYSLRGHCRKSALVEKDCNALSLSSFVCVTFELWSPLRELSNTHALSNLFPPPGFHSSPSFLSIRSRRILNFPPHSQGERTIKAEALQACTGTILLVLNVEDKTGSIFKSNSQEPQCVRCCSRFSKTLLPTFLSPCPFRPVALSPQVP